MWEKIFSFASIIALLAGGLMAAHSSLLSDRKHTHTQTSLGTTPEAPHMHKKTAPAALSAIPRPNPQFHVAIVGGGLAGLAAAGCLEEAHIPFVLLEGSNRLGGRVFPIPFENGFLQHGAEYINGEANELYSIAEREGLFDRLVADNYLFDTTTKVAVNGQLVGNSELEALQNFALLFEEMAVAEAEGPASHKSIAERFWKKFRIYSKDLPYSKDVMTEVAKMYLSVFYEMEWSAPANQLALANLDEWDDKGANDDNSRQLGKIGFAKILQHFVDKIRSTNIRLNSKVERIDYSGDTVKLSLSDGEVVTCYHTIVTCPLGFLKKHHQNLFVPPLPILKQKAIKNMGFGRNMKIFVEFSEPWCPLTIDTLMTKIAKDSAVLGDEIVSFQKLNWNQNIMVIWLGPSAVLKMNNVDDYQLRTIVQSELRSLLPETPIPSINQIIWHNWYDDPLIGGSYSFLTPQAILQHEDIIADLAEPIFQNEKPVLCFAGEATHPNMYQTTIGAVETGRKEANRIIDFITNASIDRLSISVNY